MLCWKSVDEIEMFISTTNDLGKICLVNHHVVHGAENVNWLDIYVLLLIVSAKRQCVSVNCLTSCHPLMDVVNLLVFSR